MDLELERKTMFEKW